MIDYLITGLEGFQTGKVPEHVIRFLETHKHPLIVLDESSKIKTTNPCRIANKSKRTRAIQKLNKVDADRGILTGTFMSQSPVNAWDQMEFLKKNYFGMSMSDFADTYTVRMTLPIGRGRRTVISEDSWIKLHRRLVKAQGIGPKRLINLYKKLIKEYAFLPEDLDWIKDHEEYTPYKNMEKLWEEVKKVCMVVHKEDCTDLPPLQKVVINVPLSPEVQKMYQNLLDYGFLDTTVADNSMSLYHQLQDICNGYTPIKTDEGILLKRTSRDKLDFLDEKLDEIDLARHQVIVWCNRKAFLTDVHKEIKEHTGVMCAKLDGNTSEANKALIEERFTSGECRVVCINQQTGSYGLDWLGQADYALYISTGFPVEHWIQSLNRIDRYREGEIQAKTAYMFVVGGTVEERVMNSLLRGEQLIHSGGTDRAVFDLYDPKILLWPDGTEVVF